MRWDIVTLSLAHQIPADTITNDILHYQNLNFPNSQEILVVNDASEDVGSGGSALNALIRTAERLCYRRKLTVLTEQVLEDVNVLIVLVSDPKAILSSQKTTNGEAGFIFDTYLTNSIKNATQIAENSSEKGVWIIGSDAFWNMEEETTIRISLPQNAITGFSFITDKSEKKGHGWYQINSDGEVIGMEFDGETSGKRDSENVGDLKTSGLMILGFLYLPSQVATSFLSLYSEFPVAATTYLGVDSNVTPLKLSIFFDFMLATCTSRERFVSNKLGDHVKISENVQDRSKARKQIYEKLKGFKTRVETLQISDFEYKMFPGEERSYSNLLENLYQSKSPDVERALRTQLSIQIISGLDSKASISKILLSLRDQISKSQSSEGPLPTIFTASLALSLASDGKGGLRNGPAKNPIFEKLMEGNDSITAIFTEILENWVDDPSKMIRAARHLETAAQKCIREMVDELCATRSLQLHKSSTNHISSAKVSAPVRIDFFGGWLDTPPIFFSMENAAVANMAVKLDGKNPITCHVTKISSPHIELCQDGTSILITSDQELLHMHDKPSETGSLVCACIVALGFRSLSSLFEVLQCTGLRIETRSELPHGSGLGTSSIMACTILKAICALGKVSEDTYLLENQIVHTVLRVEQIMTTGGGWQDQFGAMYPGLKKCYHVKGDGIHHDPIPLSPAVQQLLEQRLLLVYTGKTRLAKNLLQEVIRNFFTCSETKKKLKEMADGVEEFVRRIEKGDVAVDLLEQYHKTKNFLTRSEPLIVTKLLRELKSQNLISVGWCAGAGGGGFLYLWLTPEASPASVKNLLESDARFSKMTFHGITIPLVVPPVTLDRN